MEGVETDNMAYSIELNETLLKSTDSNLFNSREIKMNDVCSIGTNNELLKAVDLDNLAVFKKMLRSHSIDLNYYYLSTKPYTGTIFDICCKHIDKSDFVRELLTTSVDVNYLTENEKKALIHFAAMNGCKDTLNLLLEDPRTDINILDDDGNSALHLATIAESVECISLLLHSKDIKPNQLNRQGLTPAYIAATSNQKNNKIIAMFIRCPKVYLNMMVQDKPLREVIEDNYPNIIPFKYLYSNDTEGFIWHINSTRELDGYDGEYTYLQYACNFCLPKVVQALLDLDVDPNERIRDDDVYPVFIAAHKGFADVVQVFLDSKKSVIYQMNRENTRVVNNVVPHYTSVLHAVISGWAFNRSKETIGLCDYEKTYKLLLPVCTALDINYADAQGNTCLHYAAFVCDPDCIASLLDHGAYMGKKNNRGKPPLANISHDMLQSYLNKCVNTNSTSKNDIEYEIKCSYKFLCPPIVYKQTNKENQTQLQESQKIILADIPETYPLMYMSEIPELRSLLLHPVLTTFLYLKWSKVKWYYFMHLFFYLGFLVSLTAYILCSFEVSLQKIECKDFYSWVMVFYIGFIIRELFQLISCPFNYITTSANLIKISVIILTAGLLCENLTVQIRVPLSIVAIQMSWGELILILGQHPIFSVPLVMFKVVSKNYLKFLTWYLVFIIAFVLSCYVLFKNKSLIDLFPVSFTTIIMLNEEFNSNLLFGRLLLILFVFVIAVVLVNFLNSLAVNDTRTIQKNAEIVAHISRTKFIYSFETMLIRNGVSEINCSNFGRHIFSLLTRWLGIKLLFFPDALKCAETTIFPDNKNIINFGSSTKISMIQCIRHFQNDYLDNESITKAKTIIKSNEDKIDILAEEIKEIKQMLKLEKREKSNEDKRNVFIRPVAEYNRILNLKKRKKSNEDNSDVIIKAVEEFKDIINSEKRKRNNKGNINTIVRAVEEFKEMLNSEKRKKSKAENLDV